MDGRTREDKEKRGWKERKDVHMSEKPSLRVTVSVSVREGVSKKRVCCCYLLQYQASNQAKQTNKHFL